MNIQKTHPFSFKDNQTQALFESWLEVYFKQPTFKEISSTICSCGYCEWIREGGKNGKH